MSDPQPLPQFSVVVPFHNEGAVAFDVVKELCAAMASLGLAWEAILVDDGSSDGTGVELMRACAPFPQCRIVAMNENRGQGFALYTGILEAKAPVIGMMDGDGQNVPTDFRKLLSVLENADLVVGIRADRHDSWTRRVASKIANAVRSRFLSDHVSDAGCAVKVFRREVIKAFVPIRMLNPFMPALAVSQGFRLAEVPVAHRERTAGLSHYGTRAILWKPMIDMVSVRLLIRRRARVDKALAAAGN